MAHPQGQILLDQVELAFQDSERGLATRKNSAGAPQMALVVKNPPVNAGDMRDCGSILGQEDSLENPTDRGVWRAIVQRVTQSHTH